MRRERVDQGCAKGRLGQNHQAARPGLQRPVPHNPTRWWWTIMFVVCTPATVDLLRDTTQTWPRLLVGSVRPS